MSKQDGDSRPLEDIPDIDGIIIVSSKQQATLKQEVRWLLNQLLPFDFLFTQFFSVISKHSTLSEDCGTLAGDYIRTNQAFGILCL